MNMHDENVNSMAIAVVIGLIALVLFLILQEHKLFINHLINNLS